MPKVKYVSTHLILSSRNLFSRMYSILLHNVYLPPIDMCIMKYVLLKKRGGGMLLYRISGSKCLN